MHELLSLMAGIPGTSGGALRPWSEVFVSSAASLVNPARQPGSLLLWISNTTGFSQVPSCLLEETNPQKPQPEKVSWGLSQQKSGRLWA